MSRGETLAVRFWSKVDVRGPDDCWEWTAGSFRGGYGAIWDRWKTRKAHRVSYELQVGPIPEGMEVCHRCDNPPCQNAAHLFLGTRLDNSQDMVSKGRAASGEAQGSARLNTVQVAEIRARYASGSASHRRLASEFGISKTQIGRIVRGEKWRTA